ncbi:MAG TPA: hypothetical protein VIW45_05890 [Vicinamibacterales bacterium]|jgi:hypothetical protein
MDRTLRAYRFANDHGPVALIAVAALAFMAWLWMTTLSSMAAALHDHTRDSNWFQRQTCINVAIIAGTSTALCDPPAPGDGVRR